MTFEELADAIGMKPKTLKKRFDEHPAAKLLTYPLERKHFYDVLVLLPDSRRGKFRLAWQAQHGEIPRPPSDFERTLNGKPLMYTGIRFCPPGVTYDEARDITPYNAPERGRGGYYDSRGNEYVLLLGQYRSNPDAYFDSVSGRYTWSPRFVPLSEYIPGGPVRIRNTKREGEPHRIACDVLHYYILGDAVIDRDKKYPGDVLRFYDLRARLEDTDLELFIEVSSTSSLRSCPEKLLFLHTKLDITSRMLVVTDIDTKGTKDRLVSIDKRLDAASPEEHHNLRWELVKMVINDTAVMRSDEKNHYLAARETKMLRGYLTRMARDLLRHGNGQSQHAQRRAEAAANSSGRRPDAETLPEPGRNLRLFK